MEGPCVQTDRGVLAPGMKADINVFQPPTGSHAAPLGVLASGCDHPGATILL